MILFLTTSEALEIILAGLALGIVLVIAEILKRKHLLHHEIARKTVHISAGLIMASLPLYMTKEQIITTNLAFLTVAIISTGWLHVFSVVHAVRRWTIGEFLYPLSAAIIAFAFEDIRIYSLSVLMLAMADGLAGVLGKRYGNKTYKTLGSSASVFGSLMFLISALFILASFTLISVGSISLSAGLIIASGVVTLTATEALLGLGLDNMAVPFLTAWLGTLLLG